MNEILQYLKANGEQLDTVIAQAVGVSISTVRKTLAEMTANGELMSCLSIKFDHGKKIEGMSYRIAGFIPKAAPGRKSTRVNLKLS
jgi:DNA-binding Lrp family transcriptional regulator